MDNYRIFAMVENDEGDGFTIHISSVWAASQAEALKIATRRWPGCPVEVKSIR